MAVGFILGRSGTGKSRFCTASIADALTDATDTQQLILLVPEQATFQAERAILSDRRVAGYSDRLNVLSFDRLGFLLLGRHTARTSLSRLGRQMIIQRLLRERKGRLKVFQRCAELCGLGSAMAETITEMHRYAKGPEDIDRLVERLQKGEQDNLTALKFADIGLIFKEYLDFIEGKFIDPDVQLNLVRAAAGRAEWAKGARLWVDGFASFTTGELAILTELLKVTARTQIALCLDPSKMDLANPDTSGADIVELFYPTRRTYAELVEIIRKCRLQLAEPIILDKAIRFQDCPQLAHIERSIFGPRGAKVSAAGVVRIAAAPDLRREVRFVAKQIVELVREKGFRYRDVAVVASDLDSYEHYIRACFGDYSVPFFIDKRRSLSQHPVVRLVCSAIGAAAGGFSSREVLSFLKSGLVPAAESDVFQLENYCLAFGIKGSDWHSDKDWHFAPAGSGDFDEERINQVRREAVRPLLELRDALCPGEGLSKEISAERFTRAVFDFLDGLGVCERIGGWIEEALERGDYATADEHRQFYHRFVDIFDEFTEVFAGERMCCGDYLAILNSAFSKMTLAFIPQGLDQVLVGSVERSRHPDLKAVFLIGATQRQFPAALSYSGILTDHDRGAAEGADFSLGSATAQVLAERQYLTYIAFTRASQLLYVTYPLVEAGGSNTARSQFVADLETLFDDVIEESISDEEADIEKVCSDSELADLLCSRLGRDSFRRRSETNREQLCELLDDICADEQLAKLGSEIVSAVSYQNPAELDRQLIERLFAWPMRSSATRLGTFAACPYRHFARYVLGLKERKEFKFEPLDVGDFYHRVLDLLLKELRRQKKDIAAVEDKELLKLLSEQVSKFVQTDSFLSKFAGHSAHNAFIIRSSSEVLEDCVLAIRQMVSAGSFRPILSEASFGDAKDSTDSIGECKIDLPDGRLLFLNGKIDRLDAVTFEGEKLAVVFDYKKTGSSFSWARFYHGLDMQLAIYMLAVGKAAGSPCADCVGAFYMPVEVGAAKSTLAGLLEEKQGFDYKAKGIFNGDFANQLDGQTGAKDSEFYNFYVTTNGEPYGHYHNRGALRPGDFEKVLRFAEAKIVELVEQITSGRIEVKPYRLGTNSPCGYCEYRPLCRFDWQINDYNFLELLGKAYVLEKIGD